MAAARKFRRWRTLTLLGVVGLLVAGAFLAGLRVGDEYGTLGMKRYVKSVVRPWVEDTTATWRTVGTALQRLDIERIRLPGSERTGGAIEEVGGTLVFATPEGRLGYVLPDRTTARIGVDVPMNLDALLADPVVHNPDFKLQWFRVNDLLAVQTGPDRYDLLVSHHRYRDHCIDFRISRLAVSSRGGAVTPLEEEMTPLYVAPPCMGFRKGPFPFAGHQAGGRMVRLNDRQLLLSIGDHHFDGAHGMPASMTTGLPPERAFPTDPSVALGKIMLVDLDSGAAEVYATGIRNPQGLLLDSVGRVWETEHGPQGGDELNLIVRGENYGWPEVTLGLEYGSQPWPFNPVQGRHAGFHPPQFAWVTAIGVGNLIEADRRQFPAWDGDLLVSSLLSMTMFRLRLEGDRVLYTEPIWIGERVRDAVRLDDGRVALYADSAHAIFVLSNGGEPNRNLNGDSPDGPVQRPARVAAAATAGNAPAADTASGAHVFETHCASCHSLHGRQEIGPYLNGVIGRRAGATEGYAYSTALRNSDREWNRRRLMRFIQDPQSESEGCRMPPVALDEGAMDELLTFLETQSGAAEPAYATGPSSPRGER